mmetsp:Transcript_73094/g.201719  ORF Transcript_73094/g.201719 Transcript_73094/m.201719 type:complete len:399 (-) Transcript_73094:751-1947(-)
MASIGLLLGRNLAAAVPVCRRRLPQVREAPAVGLSCADDLHQVLVLQDEVDIPHTDPQRHGHLAADGGHEQQGRDAVGHREGPTPFAAAALVVLALCGARAPRGQGRPTAAGLLLLLPLLGELCVENWNQEVVVVQQAPLRPPVVQHQGRCHQHHEDRQVDPEQACCRAAVPVPLEDIRHGIPSEQGHLGTEEGVDETAQDGAEQRQVSRLADQEAVRCAVLAGGQAVCCPDHVLRVPVRALRARALVHGQRHPDGLADALHPEVLARRHGRDPGVHSGLHLHRVFVLAAGGLHAVEHRAVEGCDHHDEALHAQLAEERGRHLHLGLAALHGDGQAAAGLREVADVDALGHDRGGCRPGGGGGLAAPQELRHQGGLLGLHLLHQGVRQGRRLDAPRGP